MLAVQRLFVRRCGAKEIAVALAIALFGANWAVAETAELKRPTQIVAERAAGFTRSPARAASATERLLSDARDGKFDDFPFLAAALIASGAEDAGEVQKWLGMYEPVRAGILSGLPAGTATGRLKAIHGAAHRFVLTGRYESSCSDLRRSFSSGDFNCLTSLAVCWDLCQGAGLNVQPLLVQGHVVLVFRDAKGAAQAFEAGSAEWLVHPVTDLSASRRLSSVQLVGKFYYNRGVEELRAGGYRNGLTMLRTSFALDPSDDDARANLVAGLNNWAVEECRAGHYEEAESLIEQGLSLDATFGPLITNKQLVQAKLRK